MQKIDLADVRAQAEYELRCEQKRALIEAEKARLRAQPQTSLWQRLISKLPFTITLERKKA
jgi:hypothetical protein